LYIVLQQTTKQICSLLATTRATHGGQGEGLLPCYTRGSVSLPHHTQYSTLHLIQQ